MSQRLSQILRHLSAPTSLLLGSSLTALIARDAAAVSTGLTLNGTVFTPAPRSTMATATTPSTSAAIQNATRTIHTAACLIIGDEVLGGKACPVWWDQRDPPPMKSNKPKTGDTKDTNSTYMAQWCFAQGIALKRIEVVEDDEDQIMEAVRRMSDNYDLVVTSGGIGPTHDDITYPSIAKAFGLELKLYEEAFARMRRLMKQRPSQPHVPWDVDSPELRARLRMVELPTDPNLPPESQFLYPREDLWVPICRVNGNVHILPGVPRLFEMLLDSLRPLVTPRLAHPQGITRVLISTPFVESLVAPYLTELAVRVAPRGVKVGSYPRWNEKSNTVTLVGRDEAFIESLVPEVVAKVQGRRISKEGEDDHLQGEPSAYD